MSRAGRQSSVQDLLETAFAFDRQRRRPGVIYADASPQGALSRVLHMLERRGKGKRAPAADPAATKAFAEGLRAGLGLAPPDPPPASRIPHMKHR